MLILVAVGVVMLVALLVLNWKMDATKVRRYQIFVKVFGIAGMAWATYFSPRPAQMPLAGQVTLMFICAWFFVTEYIQYRKKEVDAQETKDIEQKIVSRIVIELILIATAIYPMFAPV